ncbi:MAG: 50S ribosomal protein L6 [Anaerolinea sp.]|nr:50S ribosomal protein L6 [Anaerolinea sp.]MCC6972679.1 50S ribosomal protein L6 [Anaerolineae bacterium]CAG0966292.1 50S ribosomal protein L6 [Anaerolineae bacterium]
MSRIGKQPVKLPAKVQVSIEGALVTVKGPKGELSASMHPNMKVTQDQGVITVERPDDERENRALHGLTRALINNMVTGVSTGFKRTLLIEGVGYRAEMKGKNLVLYLGYSHPIEVEPPAGITFSVGERNVVVNVEGPDKQVVGQVAANIRKIRPPEPYLGKGVRYEGEIIRRKAGKAGKGK